MAELKSFIILPDITSMMKTASQAAANAELARAFADIGRASKHEEGAILHARACKMSGIRVVGAGWERVSATARVVFIIYVCEQEVMALKYGKYFSKK